MSVTVCIITRDEAAFLPDCLKSILQLTNDVVLIDTGSMDETLAIARDYGCKVFEVPWQDDFSAARNYALEKASGEWILTIDADERIHMLMSQTEFNSFLSTTEAKAFKVPVASYIGSTPRNETTFLDERIILFRNDPEVRFQHRVHEDLSESLYRRYGRDVKIDCLPMRIEHLGYLDAVVENRQKHQRNLRLLELEIKENGESPWINYCLGVEWSSCKQWEKALQPLKRVVDQAKGAPFWTLAAYTLAYAYLQLGMLQQCMDVSERVLHVKGEFYTEFALLKSVASWQTYSSLAELLQVFTSHNSLSPEDYYAFVLAYQKLVYRMQLGYIGHEAE
ncbi:glycosyltransferase family 2 protein [Sulfoacidibacillus thermotolerans]|uniref:Glycosyltransferase 2-like domain-containing protein n=1 Tax=Sulfoacidibacillus thermotolerans TaxID=1765684 RepID=A0A2U3D991_SULT2|nr:glycosyltransferase family 2 protein [Sulfoacidibacillus thermotolerans]PWI57858.1 hypothetical protein BM613_06660 [Sulfoacidibacillus thermotolerans]